MDFDTALTIWREEVVVDDDTTQWPDEDGNRLLRRSATEIAGMLQLVRGTDATLTAAADATEITPPGDFRNVVKDGLYIRNRRVVLTGPEEVLGKRFLTAGFPRYFSYDPEYGGNILIAPATMYALTEGDIVLRYEKTYSATDAAGDAEIWNGVYPEWHHIVPLHAGIATFRMVELYDRAERFRNLFMTELQSFAAVLGRTNLAQLVVPREQRDDTRSVTQ